MFLKTVTGTVEYGTVDQTLEVRIANDTGDFCLFYLVWPVPVAILKSI